MRRIAIYGKGGSGKSTVASNLSAALRRLGLGVMQIGCDPKTDSTRTLAGGRTLPAVLEVMRDRDGRVELGDIVFEGEDGTLCVECGGPTPGLGCAGWGIIAAFRKLDELDAFGTYRPDVVIYDILGDVVCGGFAMPMRDGYAREIIIVSSGEPMALFAARNIRSAIDRFRDRGYARLTGLVQNSRHVPREDELIDELVEESGVPLLGRIPRDDIVQACEDQGRTVVTGAPDSDLAGLFRSMAERIREGGASG